MWIDIPYKTLKERHPELVQDVIDQVKRGRSKYKNVDPELWAWGYDWCVRIEGAMSGAELMKVIAGKKPFPKKPEPKSDKALVADYERCAMVSVAAKIGKAEWLSKEDVRKLPQEIAEGVLKEKREDDAEKARWSALSPEDQDVEMQETLRALGRSPGFMAFGIPRRRP